MKSYLTNRTQYVEINDVKSDTLKMMTGVPPRFDTWSSFIYYIYK